MSLLILYKSHVCQKRILKLHYFVRGFGNIIIISSIHHSIHYSFCPSIYRVHTKYSHVFSCHTSGYCQKSSMITYNCIYISELQQKQNLYMSQLLLVYCLLIFLSAVVDRRYLGCYQDSRDSRIFEKQQIEEDRTTDNCVQYCAGKNFPLSGTQVS